MTRKDGNDGEGKTRTCGQENKKEESVGKSFLGQDLLLLLFLWLLRHSYVAPERLSALDWPVAPENASKGGSALNLSLSDGFRSRSVSDGYYWPVSSQ